MTASIEVTARELRDDPRKYDGLRVRFRDIVHHQFEGMSAAGAWWTPTGGDIHGSGCYLADVEGFWSSQQAENRGGHGHMGMWPAEISGTAIRVSFDAPRSIEEARLRTCEELVPLHASGAASALMQGWFWEGLELFRLGEDCRMPNVDRPHAQPISAVFCRDTDRLYVASYELVAPSIALVPRRVEPAALSTVCGGEYIEVEGKLAAGAPYDFPTRDGWPQCVHWPRLEGALDVVLPEIATSPHRYAIANVQSPGMARWLELLANGPRKVLVVGEVRIARGDPGQQPRHQLWATELGLY
jgi:hypothetical protein